MQVFAYSLTPNIENIQCQTHDGAGTHRTGPFFLSPCGRTERFARGTEALRVLKVSPWRGRARWNRSRGVAGSGASHGGRSLLVPSSFLLLVIRHLLLLASCS